MKIIIVTLFIALAVYPNSVELMNSEQERMNAFGRTCMEALAAGANIVFMEERHLPGYFWYKDERTGFHRILPNAGHFLLTWKGVTMGRIDGDLLKPIYIQNFENGGRFIIVMINHRQGNHLIEFDEASARLAGVFGPWRNIIRAQREQAIIARNLRENAERQRVERERVERERVERERVEREHAERERAEREGVESSTEKERGEGSAERERAESSAERERAESSAERERAEKERAERERSG